MNIVLGGNLVELLPSGAAWIPALRTLCIADIHFEKGSFFSRFATFLPPYDSIEILRRLGALIEHYLPDTVIAVGDSFHDGNAAQRLPIEQRDQLNALTKQVRQWYWLSGNHDPMLPTIIHGLRQDELLLGGICFRHQTSGLAGQPEISGHYHPKLTIRLSGQRLGGPCFVHQNERLILPAFGHYTGGLDIASPAFYEIMPLPRQVYLMHTDTVYAMGEGQ